METLGNTFLWSDQAGSGFTLKQAVIIAVYLLCVPGFHFHGWQKVAGFTVWSCTSPPVWTYRQHTIQPVNN